ncbi:LamG-like jellyroll fold domain-containing protein [Pseudoalteromonas sp. McH1-42]|uniref:LamG-like jellyroll fold domain-containing protein n=1 Tax=Pseudoalteromonas sp. McH1-42 TaxID=2917752 RepID=UPI001EF5B53D|nr:LamG-like jellyroll fold domain-containing protein [Pseudoalteromonas sp. McH1-42]MCG7562054.1 cadherin domain-containing protein [Pseudoalteromonas sp. McH1-42]
MNTIMRNKLYLALLTVGTSFPNFVQATPAPLTINVDENTKANTIIGTVSFLDGESDKKVRLEVGKTEIKNWVTNGEAFEPISFTSTFTQAPIVFGQIQSNSDYQVEYEVSTYSYSGVTSKNNNRLLMRHRLDNVTALGFEAVLESELDKKGTSVIQSFLDTGEGETLGWIAFAEPISAFWNDKPIDVSSTGTSVTHNTHGHAFSVPMTDTPNILTSLSTYNGTSQSGVAIDELSANKVKVHIDNLDDASHAAENVNVFALQGTGLLFTETMAIVGETGVITVDDNDIENPFSITFSKSYNNPVVFVQAVGKDKQIFDAAVRLNFVAPMMLEGYLHSNNENLVPNRFGEFELHYQIFEAGRWDIPLEHYTYSIVSGNDAGVFSVDPVKGEIKVADQTQLDFELGNNQYSLTVRATDGAGNHYDTPVTINVTDINDSLNNNAQSIDGLAADDWAGWSVAPAGDVNGDGFDDIIVGSPQADVYRNDGTFMYEDNGAAYVLFSDATGTFPSLTEVIGGTRGFGIMGAESGDNAGFAVAGGVDINGDGLSDVVVGAPYADTNGENSGSTYVIFGKTGTNYVPLSDMNAGGSDYGFAIHGAYTEDYAGGTLVVGDVNGDGLGDIVIGETVTRFLAGTGSFALRDLLEDGTADPNLAYVVYGKKDNNVVQLANVATDYNEQGFAITRPSRKLFSDWYYGAQVLPTGDFNSDGLTDFIVSHGLFVDTSGTSYVVHGRIGGEAVNYNSIKSAGNGIKITPQGSGNYGFDFGDATLDALPSFTTSHVGDVNADGVDDIALLLTDTGCCSGIEHPRAYILFGGVDVADEINLADIANGNGGFVIHNDASNIDHSDLQVILGSIGGAGDLNGDGFDDIIIGDPFAEDNKGRVYAVYGRAGTEPVYLSEIIETQQGFYSEGNGGEQLGQFIASAGDINGDGIKDIQFGTPSANKNNVNNTGAVYVLNGDGKLVTLWGTEGNDTITGTASADNIATGTGDDVIRTNGGTDAVYAGPGEDTIYISDNTFTRIDAGGNTDTLVFDGSGINLDLATQASRVRNVEVFDIRGSGANSITLNKSVSSNSNLRILGDNDDYVGAANNQWVDSETTQVIDNVTYKVFTSGSATMLVQDGLTVTVNNAPTIEDQTFTVSEIAASGTGIGILAADANDVGDFVTFQILSGNEDGDLVLDAQTGVLSISPTISRLDFEKTATYTLQVIVYDQYNTTDTAQITVDVLDMDSMEITLEGDVSGEGSYWGDNTVLELLGMSSPQWASTETKHTWNVPEENLPDDPAIIRIESHGKIHYVGGMDLFGGWVEADIPLEMDLRFPDEIAAGQPVNLATKFTVGENANFIASSPGVQISAELIFEDYLIKYESALFEKLNGQTKIDYASYEKVVGSESFGVYGDNCANALNRADCYELEDGVEVYDLTRELTDEKITSLIENNFYELSVVTAEDHARGVSDNITHGTSFVNGVDIIDVVYAHKGAVDGIEIISTDVSDPTATTISFIPANMTNEQIIYFIKNLTRDSLAEVPSNARKAIEKAIGLEVDKLRFLAGHDLTDWVSEEIYWGSNWTKWHAQAGMESMEGTSEQCIDNYFAPAGEDLYRRYKFSTLDTFVSAALDLHQDFELNIESTAILVLEDGTEVYFDPEEDITFTPELTHDVNNDGMIDATLTVNAASKFVNNTKMNAFFRMPFKLLEFEYNVQEAVCTADNIYTMGNQGLMFEKGSYGPLLDSEKEIQYDTTDFGGPTEITIAQNSFTTALSFDLCSNSAACGEPVLSYGNNAPVASEVTLAGDFIGKSTVSASYTYTDHESDIEESSRYQWYRSATGSNDDAQVIEGEFYQSYTLSLEDIDSYVAFCVTPHDGTDFGNPECSEWSPVESPYHQDLSIMSGFGQSIVINGTDQSMVQTMDSGFNPNSSYTIEAWVKVNSLNPEENSNLFTFSEDANTSKAAVRIFSDGRLRVKATNTTFKSTETITVGQWQHYAVSYDQPTQQLSVYLDGELIISEVDAAKDSNVYFVWGSGNDGISKKLDANIDEIRILDYAKSQESIAANRYLGASLSNSNLVSYYHFDSMVNGELEDLTGESAMTLVNGPELEKHNTYLTFDGNGDYIDFGDPVDGSLDFGGDNFTAQAWIYLEPGSGNQTRIILNKKIGGANGYKGWTWSVNTRNRLTWNHDAYNNGKKGYEATGQKLTTGRWYHAAVVVDWENAAKVTMYLDGKNVGSSGLGTKRNLNNHVPLRIGAYSSTDTTTNTFKGHIDDVAIWTRALSEDEINACKEEMALGCQQDLLLYHDFEQDVRKNKAIDRYNGTIFGAVEVDNSLDVKFTTTESATFAGKLPGGNGVTFGLADAPAFGDVAISEYSGEFIYTPNGSANGASDSFSYYIYTSSNGQSQKQIVTIEFE